MKIQRRFTSQGKSPYENITFKKTSCEIRNPDGSVAFKLADITVQEACSQVDAYVMAH